MRDHVIPPPPDPAPLIARVPSSVSDHILPFAANPRNRKILERALCIRAVESVLLDFFGRGKLHGTIHTCVGQELIGVIVGAKLKDSDFVTSNHRSHGHFIGATGNWRGLIDEIAGNIDGVCAGAGSSQHLYSKNFLSNGPQASLVPVGAGIALDRKRSRNKTVAVSFIGDGTLGEGVLYETLNIDSLWGLPHVIVCEDNWYSQSTPQTDAVAGDIGDRAKAFGIAVQECDTWRPDELDRVLEESLAFARTHVRPIFVLIHTYRLNAHSKGDDYRSIGEISWFRAHDPLTVLMNESHDYREYYGRILAEVEAYTSQALNKPVLSAAAYAVSQLPKRENHLWTRYSPSSGDRRMGEQLNEFYTEYLRSNGRAVFIGEDVSDPYGGAFRISKGMATAFPDRVITTPISEGAITGVGVGLALSGNRPLVEIMFGDFMTLAFDQLVNNASKAFHMYGRNVSCPVVVRAPMGGYRGYGPTHSQSLERFLVGIDNCVTLSINSLIDAGVQLSSLSSLLGPALVLENKVDYTFTTFRPPDGYVVEIGDAEFPTVIVRPENTPATVTMVAYGGVARMAADNLVTIFENTDQVPELVVPTMIHPLDLTPVRRSVAATGKLLFIEEGVAFASLGSEVIARLVTDYEMIFQAVRIGAPGVPVPAAPELEKSVLPNIDAICSAALRLGAG